MITFSRLVKVVYVFGLVLALYLLLEPARSQAQFRGSPGIPGLSAFLAAGGGFLGPVIPNDGRRIGLPPPPLMLPLNNFYFGIQYADSTAFGAVAGGGGGIAGGGIAGGGGFGGGIAGGGIAGGGGIGGFGGGIAGGGGIGGFGGGGISGGIGGFGGGMTGMGGMSMMGMGGMGGGGMGGFAGKGMGGFNGRKAL